MDVPERPIWFAIMNSFLARSVFVSSMICTASSIERSASLSSRIGFPFCTPRRAYHFRHSRNIIAQHIICRRQTSLRMQCAHHSAARRNCSCMMFCCAEMRLLCNEVCAMRKMMCADAHSFTPRRAYHFRHSRNIIAQHIICRRQTSLRMQCAHHSAARRTKGAMALASPWRTME